MKLAVHLLNIPVRRTPYTGIVAAGLLLAAAQFIVTDMVMPSPIAAVQASPQASGRQSASANTARAQLLRERTAQREIGRLQMHALQRDVATLESQLRDLSAVLQFEESNAQSAERLAYRFADLAARGYVAAPAAKAKQNEARQQRMHADSLQLQHLELQDRIRALRRQIAATDLNTEVRRAQIDRELRLARF